MLYLKQSTASQSILLGPFVDDTDGTTAETGLTIANTDIRLSANGGNMFSKTSGGGTHDEAGWYTITLDATDTATVGRLQISCKVAGALHVFMECQILEEEVYDDIFGTNGTGYLKPTVAGRDVIVDANSRAEVLLGAVTHTGAVVPTVSTLTGHTAQTGDSFARIGSTGSGLTSLAQASVCTEGRLSELDAANLPAVTDGIQTDLDNGTDGLGALKTLIDALNDVSTSDILTQVNAALDTAISELGVAAPTATPTLRTGLMLLYMSLRNKVDITATTKEIHNDAGTKICEKVLSDDGTTYTEGELA